MNEQQVDALARKLFAQRNVRCDCGGPDTGQGGHSPDCSWELEAERAWEDAEEMLEQEREEAQS